MFELVGCYKNDAQVCSIFNKMVFNPSLQKLSFFEENQANQLCCETSKLKIVLPYLPFSAKLSFMGLLLNFVSYTIRLLI